MPRSDKNRRLVKGPTPIDSFLLAWTGQNSVWWLDFIGREIAECAEPLAKNPKLSWCNPSDWVLRLSRRVQRNTCQKLAAGTDENIFHSCILSVVLCLWWMRLSRAKAYDPRRKPEDRRKLLESTLYYQGLICWAMLDESKDHEFFKGQEWECPFPPSATYKPDAMEKARKDYTKKKIRK